MRRRWSLWDGAAGCTTRSLSKPPIWVSASAGSKTYPLPSCQRCIMARLRWSYRPSMRVWPSSLEAMACGVPVIVSDRGSLPEVVGAAGLLIDPDRPDDLADALRRILTDDALRQQCITAGRATRSRDLPGGTRRKSPWTCTGVFVYRDSSWTCSDCVVLCEF